MRVLLIDQIAKVNFRYTFPLANSLVKNGIDVRLVIDQKQEKENCECERIRLFNTDEKGIGKLSKLKNYVTSYMKIGSMLQNEPYDVLHTEWYSISPIDYHFIKKYKKKYHFKYVATVHDILPFNQKFYDMSFHRKLYGVADSIILQAPANVDRFSKLFPEYSYKTRMIPHGHMLDYINIQDKAESRKHLGLPNEKKILLFFGQIKKVKGVDILLKAMLKVVKEYDDLMLVIAGSVQYLDFDECQSILDSGKLGDQIRADIKYIPDADVKYYYSACDACVLPYTDVYQSGVIQLAYGYKKPVIASDLPAFTQFVIEGKTGYVAKAGDVDSLAKTISRAVRSSSSWVAFGENGYELVKEELNWDKIGKRIICECYEQ